MWNLQTHSEKEDSAWLSHVCMLFSDLPTRKRPPFGGIRNPTSEPQWRFFLFGMSVHVIFCLNWWNLKGKDSVCKICFNFFFQPTNQSTTASCSAKMFFFFRRGYDELNDVLHGRFSAASFCKASALSVDLARHASALSCSQLQNLCLHFGVLDAEFSRRFWWVHFHPFSIIEIQKWESIDNSFRKISGAAKFFDSLFKIHRLSQWQQVGIAWRSLPMMLWLLRLDLDGFGHFKESWHVMTFFWNDCRYTIQYTTKVLQNLTPEKWRNPFDESKPGSVDWSYFSLLKPLKYFTPDTQNGQNVICKWPSRSF